MMSPVARTRGFTLIEVLVSLSLMSLIGTVMIASLELGGHTWRRVTRAATATDDIMRAQDFLRERLSTVYPYTRAETSTAPPGFLVSTGDGLEFSGFAPEAMDDGILRYQLSRSSTEPGALEVRFRRDRGGSPESVAPGWTSERLLAHVTALSVQFLEGKPDSAGHWMDHWNDATQLPRLIRIDVSFESDDPRRWPPLYIEPRVDTNANCIFDVVSRHCRGGA
jgi:general secretion pathway protein J